MEWRFREMARGNLSLALKHLQRRDSDGAAKSFRDDR
jgi:hypothetical protein